MLIDEIGEDNFESLRQAGELRVKEKLDNFQRQVDIATQGSREMKKIDWKLLYDPTIWAYKVLKDKEGNPLRLKGFQDNLINDKHRFIVAACGNQLGKTWTACVKAIHHALHVDNASVLVISRSESQAINVLDEIKWMMNRAEIKFDSVIGDVENRTELHLKGESKGCVSVIRCLPPTLGVLSYSATLIICDEIGFWEIERMSQEEYFNRVVLSRTLATKNRVHPYFTMAQIFCVSNPNGQRGVMWGLWKDRDYHQYRYSYLANPSNTLEEYLSAKRKFPSDQFDSVFAAVFSSATGGFITQQEYEDAIRSYPLDPNATRYLGGDYSGEDTKGRDVDETVLFGAAHVKENDKDMVKVTYYKIFPKRTKKLETYEEIKKLPNLIKFAYDKVGVGDSIKNDLKDRGILSEMKIESLSYSLPNKSEVYYNMKRLFEQRLVIIPDIPKLKEQLMGLRFEKTDGGHIKIHHARENLHDDCADALANSLYAAKRLRGVIPSIKPLAINKTTGKRYTLVCPKCEQEGKDSYYQGVGTQNRHFERIPCPFHKKQANL